MPLALPPLLMSTSWPIYSLMHFLKQITALLQRYRILEPQFHWQDFFFACEPISIFPWTVFLPRLARLENCSFAGLFFLLFPWLWWNIYEMTQSLNSRYLFLIQSLCVSRDLRQIFNFRWEMLMTSCLWFPCWMHVQQAHGEAVQPWEPHST